VRLLGALPSGMSRTMCLSLSNLLFLMLILALYGMGSRPVLCPDLCAFQYHAQIYVLYCVELVFSIFFPTNVVVDLVPWWVKLTDSADVQIGFIPGLICVVNPKLLLCFPFGGGIMCNG
jgi:hypothetical protein